MQAWRFALFWNLFFATRTCIASYISRKRQPGRNICICHKNFSVIIKARAFPVKFARKKIAVYFSLSLSSPRLSAGTLISSFSFFMNNGGGVRFVFAAAIAAVAVAASGQFPWYSRVFFAIRVTHANGIARCIRNNATREILTDLAAYFRVRACVWCKTAKSRWKKNICKKRYEGFSHAHKYHIYFNSLFTTRLVIFCSVITRMLQVYSTCLYIPFIHIIFVDPNTTI